MQRVNHLLGFSLLFAGFLFLSCESGSTSNKKRDTIDSGDIRIAVDATLQPVIDAVLAAFLDKRPNARITPIYTSAAEAMNLYLKDSVQLAIAPRPLTADERQWFLKSKKQRAEEVFFAIDGVVLVVHKDNPDTNITRERLVEILTGKVRLWRKDSIRLVFDQNNSSLLQFARDSIAGGKPLSGVQYAAGSNEKVLEYVAQNPAALGFIGFNWISDHESPVVKSRLQKVRLVGVATAPGKFISLREHPTFRLAAPEKEERYPLLRRIYVHNRQPYLGLTKAFASFISGKDGQMVVYKSNLVPTTGIVRLVELKEEQAPVITE